MLCALTSERKLPYHRAQANKQYLIICMKDQNNRLAEFMRLDAVFIYLAFLQRIRIVLASTLLFHLAQ